MKITVSPRLSDLLLNALDVNQITSVQYSQILNEISEAAPDIQNNHHIGWHAKRQNTRIYTYKHINIGYVLSSSEDKATITHLYGKGFHIQGNPHEW